MNKLKFSNSAFIFFLLIQILISNLKLEQALAAPALPPPLPTAPTRGNSTPPPLPSTPTRGNSTPPPLPGSPISQPPAMEPSPGMCQQMPEMPGCPPPLPPGSSSSNRLRGSNYSFDSEPNGKAPGLEEYKTLGYCTGINDGPTFTYSSTNMDKPLSSTHIRTYNLLITSDDIDSNTGKEFMKVVLNQEENGIKCGNLSHFSINELNSKNRAINAPPLFFIEGETARINVKNNSNLPITIHWHGLILPNDQDGVPNITQRPIQPKSELTYEFTIQQNGTYWYHPHDLNEQHVKGAFIIFPKPGKEMITMKATSHPEIETRYHHDRVILLTDYKKRDPLKILSQLRNNQNAYAFDNHITRGIIQQFQCFSEFMANFQNMKMFWMDKADVWYDSFFINDETCLNCGVLANKLEKPHSEFPGQKFQSLNEFGAIKTGERVRLRIINSSASTYFFVDYGNSQNLKPNQKTDMLVVAKDGQPVEPIYIDQLYMGMGETYDVIVDLPEKNTAYELRIKSIDDYKSERLARVLIGKTDGNSDDNEGISSTLGSFFSTESKTKSSVANLKQAYNVPVQLCGPPPANNDTPSQIAYSDLNRRFEPGIKDDFSYTKNTKIVNYNLELSGNMDDYHWKIEGESGTKIEADPNGIPYLTIIEGARNRITIKNTMMMGMMNHPWHLHGTFFRMVDSADIGQPNENEIMTKKPLLHTATIFPGQTMTLEIYADPKYRGAWMFHCHNLYHMENVMMMYLKYNTFNDKKLPHMHNMGEHHSGYGSILSWIDDIPKVSGQYVTAAGGAHAGLNGSGADLQLNWRGNIDGNNGYFDAIVAASKNFTEDKKFTISTTVKHCLRVNECVYIDLNFENTKDRRTTTGLVGKTIRVFNSEIAVIDGAIGAQYDTDREEKKSTLSPAGRLSGAVTLPIGWNITTTAKAGCEGAYCADAYAQFIAKLKATPNVTFTLLDCKLSSDKDATGCFAQIMIGSDPYNFGNTGH